MKNYYAKFYQLKNDGTESFSYSFNGETSDEKAKNVDFKRVAETLAHKAVLFSELAKSRIERGRTRIKFAKTKPIYFHFQVDGKTIVTQRDIESVNVQIKWGTSSESDIAQDLLEIMNIVNDDFKF